MATAPPIDQIKSAMRATWMAGDFGVIAKTITAGAEAFVSRLALPPGARVLDVATGTGNLAIPLRLHRHRPRYRPQPARPGPRACHSRGPHHRLRRG